MKKFILASLMFLCLLTGCEKSEETIDPSANERYKEMINQLESRTDFKSSSEYYDISYEVAKINDGYRFYITIDNAKVAMYGIEAIAIESDVDYSSNMAANIGLFEDIEYSLIPNQVYTEKGFVKGVSISGVSSSENPTLYLMVTWHNKDLSVTNREFFKLTLGDENG